MKNIIIPILICLIFINATLWADEKDYPSNLDLLQIALKQVIEGTFDNNNLSENSNIYLQSETEHNANWLLEIALSDYLLEKQINLYENIETSAEQLDYIISYRIVALYVRPIRIWRKRLGLGTRWIEREAIAQIYIKVIKSDSNNSEENNYNTILWSNQSEGKISDEIPFSYITYLEDENYPFTKLSIKEQKTNSCLEPLVVTSIIAGLIYLFYASRSVD